MINVVIPIAGRAQRFLDKGFMAPKPLIMVRNKHMIDWAMSSLNTDKCRLIFCVRKDHVNSHSIDAILREKFPNNEVVIIVVDRVTRGTLSTCLLAREFIDNDDPLIIYTPDVYFEQTFQANAWWGKNNNDLDGMLLTFKANSPAHSYAQTGDDGLVIQTAEKEVISGEAAVGVYCFKEGQQFVKYADEMEREEITTNGEFYICPLYNLMIRDGLLVGTEPVDKMHVLGTPEELRFFTSNTLRRFGDRAVALCADHSGFALKEKAKSLLDAANIPFIDFGTYTDTDCDHHDFLFPAIHSIREGDCDFGIAFCRTGQGFNIAANKVPGIRSALVFDIYTAEMAVRHNCANFFSIPSKYIDSHILDSMFFTWRNTTFDGGRHITRIQKSEYEW